MCEENIVKDFNDLSFILKNPDLLNMLQNNISTPKDTQNSEKNVDFSANANMIQMMSALAPMLNNMQQQQPNSQANLFSIISSLIGNNPNNIQNLIMLVNLISQMQNNNQKPSQKNSLPKDNNDGKEIEN